MKNKRHSHPSLCPVFMWIVLASLLCSGLARAQLKTTPSEAQKTDDGILRKVWFIKADTPLYKDTAKTTTMGNFPQNAKAYYYGDVGADLVAVGNKPRKEECNMDEGGFFGYVVKENTLIWDTDQALRFSGTNAEITVAVYADPGMSDKVADFGVHPTDDPTMEPFPIFGRSDDKKAFEIACVLAAGPEGGPQQQQVKMDPNTLAAVSSIDIAFVMDITGSMGEELEGVKLQVADLIKEFSTRTIDVQGRQQPLRLRFAFIGYRDMETDGDDWIESIDFINIGQEDDFNYHLRRFEAKGGGDYPESIYAALQHALETLQWGPANGKAIILIADAPAKDTELRDAVLEKCNTEFITIYSLPVGDLPETRAELKSASIATHGITLSVTDNTSTTETVEKIIDAIKTMQVRTQGKVSDVGRLAEAGGPAPGEMTAQLSRTIQEFKKRGIMPKWGEKPLPPTVFVPSMENENVEVCLYKSKAKLHDMLGGMQMDFISMAKDASPETLLALQSGGLEMIAELEPGALNSIINMDDLGAAPGKIKEMLNAMPGLPDLLKKISETNPADVAAWNELAVKTAALSRFVANPDNFFNDHAWVPFSVMTVQ
ncbi:MAG: VWA domain-containing protein [Spartobacteria bacterium]|nr:VWA domain-containing protein [Spartobacteria bacterium]